MDNALLFPVSHVCRNDYYRVLANSTIFVDPALGSLLDLDPVHHSYILAFLHISACIAAMGPKRTLPYSYTCRNSTKYNFSKGLHSYFWGCSGECIWDFALHVAIAYLPHLFGECDVLLDAPVDHFAIAEICLALAFPNVCPICKHRTLAVKSQWPSG